MNINLKNKIKYLIPILTLTVAFSIYAKPVLASQITVNSVLNLINQDREEQGLSDLQKNNLLMKVAQDKLDDMVANHYFAHTSPAGKTPWYWYEKDGYNYQYAGENLAINFLTAENQNRAWMKSPEHRKNILNPHYFQTGIAVGVGKVDGHNSMIAVEEFGSLMGATGIVANGQKFSGQKKTDLIKKENKIAPQVLAVKNSVLNKIGKSYDTITGGSGQASLWEKFSNELTQNELAIINLFSDLFALLFLITLVLIPLAFLSVALEKIISLYQDEKEKTRKAESNSFIN